MRTYKTDEGREILILDRHDINAPEYRASARLALGRGAAVNVNGFSLRLEGNEMVLVHQAVEYRFKRTPAEVLDVIAAYEKVDRIVSVLA